MSSKKPTIPSSSELTKIQQDIGEKIADIPRHSEMQLRQILETLQEIEGIDCKFKDTDLRYLQKLQLIKPKLADSNNYVYTVDNLRDILLIWVLRDESGKWKISSYSQIAGLMVQELRDRLEECLISSGAIEVSVSSNQTERGIYVWRSNLVRFLLLLLFDGVMPGAAYVFLFKPRRNLSHSNKNENYAPWLNVSSREYPNVDFLLEESELTLVTTQSGNVFHAPISEEQRRQYHGATWYLIEGGLRPEPVEYQMIVAVHEPEDASEPSVDPENTTLLLRLMNGCFLETEELKERAKRPNANVTQLDVITNLIPDLSPVWQYCTCLVPNPTAPERLIFLSSTDNSPMQGKRDVQVKTGQLLSGRAYNEKYPVVVNDAVPADDPRITEDRATAAIAVPALYNGEANGVLYVATRRPRSDEAAFSGEDIKLLQMLGYLVGQILGQDIAWQTANHAVLTAVDYQIPARQKWAGLEDRLLELFTEMVSSGDTIVGRDSIQLLAIQIPAYDELREHTLDVANWAMDQIQSAAVHYFLNESIGTPLVYERSESEILLLFPRIALDDEYEQRMRHDLRRHLNTLEINLPDRAKSLLVECELWTLSFRYSDIFRYPKQNALGAQVQDITTTTEEAFQFLHLIHLAHQYQRNGSWLKALEHFRMARAIAPDNLYIWRHIAKALTELREYEKAVDWWRRVLIRQKHPSHYRHLAHNLICINEKDKREEAVQTIKEAINLDKENAKAYRDAAVIYHMTGDYRTAIDMLEKAAVYDPDNRALYRLRIADAFLALDEYTEALNACTQARTYEPDNRDITFKTVLITQAMNSASDVMIADQ